MLFIVWEGYSRSINRGGCARFLGIHISRLEEGYYLNTALLYDQSRKATQLDIEASTETRTRRCIVSDSSSRLLRAEP